MGGKIRKGDSVSGAVIGCYGLIARFGAILGRLVTRLPIWTNPRATNSTTK